MTLPDGYSARHPRPGDLEAVAGVLAADGQTVLDAGFIQQQWSRPDFDLGSDAFVVADGDGAVVAYAQANADEPTIVESWGVVHPSHRGRGIGSFLLDWVEEHASGLLADAPSGRFRHAIDGGDRAAAAMLEARGLRPVRHFWHMEIDPTTRSDPMPSPDGIELRAIEPSTTDLRAVHGILDEAFAEDWGYHPYDYDRWVEDHTGPGYDPALWLLAVEGDEPVGALTASLLEERGWVDEVGVRAGWRGRGVGAALLRRSFAIFAERGIRRVILNVDAENPTGATRLYERVGMRVVNRWELWERSVEADR